MNRIDEFGAVQRYAFVIAADRPLTSVDVQAAQITTNYHDARLVVVGEAEAAVPTISWDRFINLFGGPIFSLSPLEPEFGLNLVELGHNRLPPGLNGRADDLFEIHVRSALEFLIAGRVIRYGQDRRFEARPDGIVLPGDKFRALYDAKAYTNGYLITADGMRQFKSYVDDFSRRYEAYLPRLNSFIVISSAFTQGRAALEDRSREFIASAGIPLSFLRSDILAEIVSLAAGFPAARRSVDWARIFADPVVASDRVAAEFEAIRRDRIIGKG